MSKDKLRDDAEAYERWCKSTPEYWSKLCSEKPANMISSDGKNSFMCSGEIKEAK